MTARIILLEGGPPWGFRMTSGAENSNIPLKISRVSPALWCLPRKITLVFSVINLWSENLNLVVIVTFIAFYWTNSNPNIWITQMGNQYISWTAYWPPVIYPLGRITYNQMYITLICKSSFTLGSFCLSEIQSLKVVQNLSNLSSRL